MNIIHPTHIRPLQAELLSTTALTPTQHKSKTLSAVIGVVAAIAIPLASPYIASTLLASLSIKTATAGLSAFVSGAVGAGLGAGVQFLRGADTKGIVLGALGGGFGGGIAGYSAGPLGANSGVGFGANVAPGSVASPSVWGGPADSAGLLASTTTEAASMVTPEFSTRSSAIIPQVGDQSFMTSADATALYEGSGGAYGTTGAPVGTYATSPPPSPSFINKFMTSDATKQAAAKGLTMALGNVMMSDTPNMTAEEEALLKQQQEARAFQKAGRDRELGISKDYLRMAKNLNPAYYGQQALTLEQNRKHRADDASRRREQVLTGRVSASSDRARALNTSRLGAYDRGRQAAENQRLRYMQSAQGSAPTGTSYATGITADLKAADKRYERSEKEYKDYAGIIEPWAADVFGTDSEEERKKKRKKAGLETT